jgi:hypothetical protein
MALLTLLAGLCWHGLGPGMAPAAAERTRSEKMLGQGHPHRAVTGR